MAEKTFEVTCPICGHTYTYTESELIFTDENKDGATICPLCGVEVAHSLAKAAE